MATASLYSIRFDQRNAQNTAYTEKFVSGSNLVLITDSNGVVTGSLTVQSSSYSFNSSQSNNSISSSYSLTASYATNAASSLTTGSTYPITASWAINASTASYALSGVAFGNIDGGNPSEIYSYNSNIDGGTP